MPIYFDHAATTPISEVAISALNNQIKKLGNASSLHSAGRSVRKDLESAREEIAKAIDCAPSEVIFTATGTEANNLAIKGLYWKAAKSNRNVIITSTFEHHAVMDPIAWLAEHENAQVININVDQNGFILMDELAQAIKDNQDKVAFISIMHSNNETGVLQPISEVVEIAGDIPVHTDAVQSFKKVELSYKKLGVTALTISAHKVGGPLGIGALILRRAYEIPALLHGGGQEREIRSGTLNAPSIVAFSAASTIDYPSNSISSLRDSFIAGVKSIVPDAYINGEKSSRLPGIVNVTFPGTQSDTLLLLLDSAQVSASTGSACSAGVHEASHVLLAMGHTEISAQSSLRFSFGATSSQADVEYVLSVLPDVIERGRAANK